MIKVGIVGGTGYTGVELLRLLAGHPDVELAVITSRAAAGTPVSEMFPNLRGHLSLVFVEPEVHALDECDVVFFATPNGTAMKLVPSLLANGSRVIDLSADFRLRHVDAWERWYGMPHACPNLLEEAVYGLPELNRAGIRSARLVANPGCYPTAVQLGLAPLLESGVIDAGRVIANAASGVSGAGRSSNMGSLYAEVGDSFKSYGVAGHRHLPEIQQGLAGIAGDDIGLTFVPHLAPMIRGIHATLYATLTVEDTDLQGLFERRYEAEPFVDVLPAGVYPDTRSVRGSNVCRLGLQRPQGGAIVVVLSVIDNLVKGAAGQAVQNMNLMFGVGETAGLCGIGLVP